MRYRRPWAATARTLALTFAGLRQAGTCRVQAGPARPAAFRIGPADDCTAISLFAFASGSSGTFGAFGG